MFYLQVRVNLNMNYTHTCHVLPFLCLQSTKIITKITDANKITNSDVMITPIIQPTEALFLSCTSNSTSISNVSYDVMLLSSLFNSY